MQEHLKTLREQLIKDNHLDISVEPPLLDNFGALVIISVGISLATSIKQTYLKLRQEQVNKI